MAWFQPAADIMQTKRTQVGHNATNVLLVMPGHPARGLQRAAIGCRGKHASNGDNEARKRLLISFEAQK